ncbi:MAG: ABC transporter ATP-binding protein, partial [Gemmobacter sp.]
MSASVELDNLTVRFGSFTAVSRATLDIAGGEFFSFLGPSGCGKTTILRAVSGFLDPTEGAVRIGGQDMSGISPNRRPTALIFQNLALFPLMTVAENIAYGLRVRGVGKAERRRKADELLELIALAGQGDKLVSELSGGQKQRVA